MVVAVAFHHKHHYIKQTLLRPNTDCTPCPRRRCIKLGAIRTSSVSLDTLIAFKPATNKRRASAHTQERKRKQGVPLTADQERALRTLPGALAKRVKQVPQTEPAADGLDGVEAPPVSSSELQAALARQASRMAEDRDEVVISHAASRGVAISSPHVGAFDGGEGPLAIDLEGEGEEEEDDGAGVMPGGAGKQRAEEERARAATANTPIERDQQKSSTDISIINLQGPHPLLLLEHSKQQVELQNPRGGESSLQQAQGLLSAILPSASQMFSFRAAHKHEGGEHLVIPVKCEPPPKASEIVRAKQKSGAMRSLVWCTLAMLGGLQYATAGVALTALAKFGAHGPATTRIIQEGAHLADLVGQSPGRTVIAAPRRSVITEGQPFKPRDLIDAANHDVLRLREVLARAGRDLGGRFAATSQKLSGYADATSPLDLSEIPPDLLDKEITMDFDYLGKQLFSEPLPVYELPWLPRMPKQVWDPRPGCEDYSPTSALDTYGDEAKGRISEWLEKAKSDLICLELYGEKCSRKDKPGVLIVADGERHRCAQGYIWDCRAGPCVLSDFGAGFSSRFHLPYLREKFKGYPDQRLASNTLDGVRLEADVQLHSVYGPNLESVSKGYESVQKTVRELRAMNFYDFMTRAPFSPMWLISQGSTEKFLHGAPTGKFRRTSDFGIPRKPHTDSDGLPVISINDAARSYEIPDWITQHSNPAMREWAAHKYAHVSAEDKAAGRGKFPKERKPMVEALARDIAIYGALAVQTDQPLFVFVADAAFYFNQFGYSPEELHKSNALLSSRPGDTDICGEPIEPGVPLFVQEKRLGFGSFPSSNICQRFSNALTRWTSERFDEIMLEMDLRFPPPKEIVDWKRRRKQLEETCRRQRRKKKGQALSDCTQSRLGSIRFYTDDPIAIAVGIPAATALVQALLEETEAINLEMAGADKIQIGGHVNWIGIVAAAAVLLIIVPKNKLIRAKDSVTQAKQGVLPFSEYRPLLGLLEHLRFVVQLPPKSTAALYTPYRHGGDPEPSGKVTLDEPMTEALDMWTAMLDTCGGVVVTVVFYASAAERLRNADLIFAASADAAMEGEGTPGIGGYVHGFYWRIQLPLVILALFHITSWEFLASILTVFVASRLGGDSALIAQQSDALLTTFALSKEKSKSDDIRAILHLLLEDPVYEKIAPRLIVDHLGGLGNFASDRVSRGLWEDLRTLADVLQVRLQGLPLNDHELKFFLKAVMHKARSQHNCLEVEAALARLFNTNQVLTTLAQRSLTPTEQFRGSTRSNNEDADGPFDDDVWKPPWAIAFNQQNSSPVGNEGGDGPCDDDVWKPPWAMASSQQNPSPPPVRSQNVSPPEGQWQPPWAIAKSTAPRRASSSGSASQHQTLRNNAHPYLRPARKTVRVPAYEVADAEQLARRIADDKGPGAIDISYETIRELVLAIQSARSDGLNPRTRAKDEKAWREFTAYARSMNFDPNLRSEWTEAFPERESVKLAGFLLHMACTMLPRSNKDFMAKPMSVYQHYLALRRVFKLRSQNIPPSATVREATKGLIKRYIRLNGIEALRPKRAEPITPAIITRAQNIPAGTRLGSLVWDVASSWVCFIVLAWMVINLSVGSRKGESTLLPGDEDRNDYFTRSCLTWRIDGRVCPVLTPALKARLGPSSVARLAPMGAKADPWGTCHGTEPIILPYRDQPLNAAKMLADIEMRWPCTGEARKALPLFCNERGEPFADKTFHNYIMAVLRHLLGSAADNYSPHSWRVWIATALRMANAPGPVIQALGRWLNPESLRIYARMSVVEYTHWIDKMMGFTTVDATRTTNLPMCDEGPALGAMQDLLERRRPRQTQTRGRDAFDDEIENENVDPQHAVLRAGTRIRVYWTGLRKWYNATVTQCKRVRDVDGGYMTTGVTYDAADGWATAAELKYVHCLDDETWAML